MSDLPPIETDCVNTPTQLLTKKILLVNDDGIDAPGLVALALLLNSVNNGKAKFAFDIKIVAPAEEQSGKSRY